MNEYLKYDYSLIPIDKEKKPYIYWKSYQYKKANIEDIFDWCNKFSDINIGIVTGDISKLVVIDVDDINLLPELKEFLPEIKETTRVRTRRGYHYYFSLNGEQVKSTNSLFGKRIELKSNGTYVVAPPSIIKAHRYVYEIPLSEILPIPKILIKENNPAFPIKDKNHNAFKIPKYHGQKVDCIRQILSRYLEVGERNNSLFILYNLLLRNKNTEEYAKKLVIKKNRSLSEPLNKIELKKVCRKASYNYGCVGIRDGLAYIK
ncbi:bifunctional DNA primase/polymerase, partial [bacterium]|nr:bifunctional DNA primase/polymerase [bacterium]